MTEPAETFNPYLVYQGVFIPHQTLQTSHSDSEKLLIAFATTYKAENGGPPTSTECAKILNWNRLKLDKVANKLRAKGVIS